MNADIEFHIRNNYAWTKLPSNIRQLVGNSHKEYDKHVINFSIANQLRHKGNLVRHVMKDEKRYYGDLLKYSQEHLMLYPYHLSDVVVKGLRVTPFQYYISMMQEIMQQEKSYDSLPNFTAADCLRLLGIGRNQYIELMNQCRSSKRFFRRRSLRELLPLKPVDEVSIEPWWLLQPGYITEDDMKMVSAAEKDLIDNLIDEGWKQAGDFNFPDVHSLYLKGLVYLDVFIDDDDYVIVPPLEGFVMNRLQGDYFETLLYKIFVSIDENTSVSELSNVLQIDLKLVKNAVSMYCRLGFARKKIADDLSQFHPSWSSITKIPKKSDNSCTLLMSEFKQESETSEGDFQVHDDESSNDASSVNEKKVPAILSTSTGSNHRRIGFLFDSTLTAFLMMGNLSPGLKSHAVTMFEVGKLSDETLDSFGTELDKVSANFAEGEAQRYFEHALTLRSTIAILRYNVKMKYLSSSGDSSSGLGLDLIRCESLQSLDPSTCTRLLKKNYELLVSMAPLTHEIRPISSCSPPHIGPAIPEVNSVWFKLFIYKITQCGPPSLLLVKGSKLKRLPKLLQKYDRLLVTTWGHDPGIVPTSNALVTINDALLDSAVLIQAHSNKNGFFVENENVYIPFPLDKNDKKQSPLANHPAILSLASQLDLQHTCGYITLVFNPDCDVKTTMNKSNSSSPCNISKDSLNAIQPTNGFKNKDSADLLETELQSLDDDNCENGNGNEPCPLNSTVDGEMKSHDRWTLLNCSFGVPLFVGHLNQSVCNKIVSNDLCSPESLKELTQSSRKLCLRLLKFVAENQLSSVAMETRDLNEASATYDVSLPTKNLIFNGKQLIEWNGW